MQQRARRERHHTEQRSNGETNRVRWLQRATARKAGHATTRRPETQTIEGAFVCVSGLLVVVCRAGYAGPLSRATLRSSVALCDPVASVLSVRWKPISQPRTGGRSGGTRVRRRLLIRRSRCRARRIGGIGGSNPGRSRDRLDTDTRPRGCRRAPRRSASRASCRRTRRTARSAGECRGRASCVEYTAGLAPSAS
jgi:hypothetical protein